MCLEIFTLVQMHLKSSKQQSHWASFIASTVHTAKKRRTAGIYHILFCQSICFLFFLVVIEKRSKKLWTCENRFNSACNCGVQRHGSITSASSWIHCSRCCHCFSDSIFFYLIYFFTNSSSFLIMIVDYRFKQLYLSRPAKSTTLITRKCNFHKSHVPLFVPWFLHSDLHTSLCKIV